MCLAKAFMKKNNKEEFLLENVACVDILDKKRSIRKHCTVIAANICLRKRHRFCGSKPMLSRLPGLARFRSSSFATDIWRETMRRSNVNRLRNAAAG